MYSRSITSYWSLLSAIACSLAITFSGQAQQLAQGLKLAYIDPTVNPCTDFFHYASGTWLKQHPVPPTDQTWGVWDELYANSNDTQRAILAELTQANVPAPKGSNAQKVGDFYASAMDSAAIERAGLQYLQPYLDRIQAITSVADEQRFFADPKAHAGSLWFFYGIGPDLERSNQYAVYLRQGGLSLPTRDYYLRDDARTKAVRAAYHTYQVTLFRLLGDAPAAAEQHAAAVLRLETRLAKVSKSRAELRDPQANYHKLSLAEANATYPNIGLPHLLRGQGLQAATEVVVNQPEFLQEVNTMLAQEPLADQQQYMRWHLVSELTSALPKAYGEATFQFEQVLTGATQQQPRWKRMLEATDDNLGEAFGQLYVDKAFPPAAKARAKQLIENLQLAYAKRIQATEWMSAATKQQALVKLHAFTVKIGYPDKWKDYASLAISRESYLRNVLAAQEWRKRDSNARLGKPVDRMTWSMTPATVNAYYSPLRNEIVFPAGILQPPFFDPKADDAANYGAIGAMIGHEMTHGFDDQGRKFDAQGNLREWWTPADGEQFKTRAAALERQYNQFSLLDSMHVNGQLTLGENLADLGGLTIAYQAFQQTPQAKAGKRLDGFTPNQRFFLAYAQTRRTNIRPEALRQQVLTDPHAPDQYRTLGPLMNMPEFWQAFGCKPGDAMVRPTTELGRIW